MLPFLTVGFKTVKLIMVNTYIYFFLSIPKHTQAFMNAEKHTMEHLQRTAHAATFIILHEKLKKKKKRSKGIQLTI